MPKLHRIRGRLIFKVNGETLYDNEYTPIEVVETEENEIDRSGWPHVQSHIIAITRTIEVTT